MLVPVLLSTCLALGWCLQGWLRWLQYLSIFHYAFQAMLINELEGLLLDFAVQSLHACCPGVV